MAKNKDKKKIKIEDYSDIDKMGKKFDDFYGEGSMIDASDSVSDFIPTGILPLDIMIPYGGIPQGKIVMIKAPEGVGKTTLLLHLLAAFQKSKKLKDREVSIFSDNEFRWDNAYANACEVSTKPGEVKLLHGLWGEANLEMAEHLIRSGKVKGLFLDSIPSLVPKDEVEGSMDDSHVGLQARMLGQALRKLIPVCFATGTTIIVTNQIRINIGVTFGNPETIPGGKALRHYPDLTLDMRKTDRFKKEPTIRNKKRKIIYGHKARVTIVKGLGGEGKQALINIFYGKGINNYANIVDIADDYNIFKTEKTTYVYKKKKVGTYKTAMKKLEEDKKFRDEIVAKIWEIHEEYGI